MSNLITAGTAPEPVKIGIVSVSDRASGGVYEDKGLPALQEWLTRALQNPITFESRLIPDEQERISATPHRTGRRRLRPGAHHRRHRPCDS